MDNLRDEVGDRGLSLFLVSSAWFYQQEGLCYTHSMHASGIDPRI